MDRTGQDLMKLERTGQNRIGIEQESDGADNGYGQGKPYKAIRDKMTICVKPQRVAY